MKQPPSKIVSLPGAEVRVEAEKRERALLQRALSAAYLPPVPSNLAQRLQQRVLRAEQPARLETWLMSLLYAVMLVVGAIYALPMLGPVLGTALEPVVTTWPWILAGLGSTALAWLIDSGLSRAGSAGSGFSFGP